MKFESAAIIGGSGVGDVIKGYLEEHGIELKPVRPVFTEYSNDPICNIYEFKINEKKCYIVDRHHTSWDPKKYSYPNEIPFTSMMGALIQELGVDVIFSTTAVGGLKPELVPGSFSVLTSCLSILPPDENERPLEGDGIPQYTDPNPPVDLELSKILEEQLLIKFDDYLKDLENAGFDHDENRKVYSGQTYGRIVKGKYYETKPEAELLAIKSDLAGMTVNPEMQAAKRAGVSMAVAAILTNKGVNLVEEGEIIDHNDVEKIGNIATPYIAAALLDILTEVL